MYRNVHEMFWTDPVVKLWGGPAKLMYLYLFTNPHAHYSGVYTILPETIGREIGASTEKVVELLDFMEKEGKIKYDQRFDCVFVVNMAKYQFRTNQHNWKVGVKNHFNKLHKCPLIMDFAIRYPECGLRAEDYTDQQEDFVVEVPDFDEHVVLTPKKKAVADPDIVEIIEYLNFKAGTKYRANNAITIGHINARKGEGFTKEDFFAVIDNMTSRWLNDEKMSAFLRPQTLFCGKFEGYLNSGGKKRTDKYVSLVEEA